jgi:DNA-binding protein H-NS
LTAQRLSEIKTVRDALTKKDTEISMLRKEAEWMKRELRNRDEEIQAMRSMKVYSKPTPKRPSAQAIQSR